MMLLIIIQCVAVMTLVPQWAQSLESLFFIDGPSNFGLSIVSMLTIKNNNKNSEKDSSNSTI